MSERDPIAFDGIPVGRPDAKSHSPSCAGAYDATEDQAVVAEMTSAGR